MCGLSAIAPIASIGFRAIGAIQQGRQQREQAEYQAQVNERNAEVQRQRIADANIRGQIEANRFRSKIDRFKGTQVSVFAGSNIDVSSATVNQFLRETEREGELDARIIENNALREAYGYAINEQQYLTAAERARFEGRNAARTGLLSAAFTVGTGLYNNRDSLFNFLQPATPSLVPAGGTRA